MQRMAAPLALLGLALAGVALWLCSEASDDKAISDSICRLGGGPCNTPMTWWPTIIFGVAGVVALAIAWRINQSVVTKRTEDLVN